MKKLLLTKIVLTLFLLNIDNFVYGQSLYKLPFPTGTTYICTQGNNGSLSHTGNAQYAFDFSMPIGTPISASRGGTVHMVQEQWANGNCPYISGQGCNSNCINNVNRIVINHGDGTYALYLHLTQNGSSVSIGQTIGQGQIIGYSGNSGCSTNPHLHFMVMNSGATYYQQSIQISFCDVYSNNGVPTSGNSYTSQNCVTCPQIPITTLPVNNSTVSIPVAFDWDDATGGNDTSYRIQVSTTNSGWTAQNGFTSSTSENNTIRVNQGTGSTSSFTWSSSSSYPPQPNTTYYYTVKTFACGQSSNYSAVKSFTTSCNASIPTLISPTNGQTNVGVPVLFDWNDVGNNPQYRIQVSTTNSGWTAQNGFTSSTSENNNIRVNQNTNDVSAYNWTSTSAYPPQGGTTYYWTVKSFACGQNSNYSSVRSFTVANQSTNYTITTSSNPTVGGGTSGNGTYAAGQNRTVTATANSGYTFSNWTENGNVISTNSSYSFILNSNRNLVANFTQQSNWTECPNYNFSLSNNSNWNTHSSSIGYMENKIYRFLVSPGKTYTFKTGCGDGATASFNTVLNLLNFNCNSIIADDNSCEQQRSSIEWTCNYSSTGWAYLMVRGFIPTSNYGNYTLAYREIDSNLSVEEPEIISKLKIYPNPFDDFIEIISSNIGLIDKVEVYDILGKLIIQDEVKQSETHKLSTDKLAQGTYIVKITTDTTSESYKIIKR